MAADGTAARSAETPEYGLKIIREATIQMQTENYSEDMAALEELVTSMGGFITSREEWGSEQSAETGENPRTLSLTLRIPSDQLDAFVEQAKQVGIVTSSSISETDVTDQYTDTDRRLQAYQKQYDRVLEMMDQATTVEELIQIESELSRLGALLSGAVSVRAEKPGIYSAACDGYEDVLTPDTLADLTVGRLENLTAGSKGSSLGKLIYGDTWYYAAAVTNEQAAQLRTGQSVTLRFAKGLDADVPATVYSIGEDEGGRQLLVLCCDRYLPQTTQLRHQQAELVLSSYSGIRVPANALRVNDEGQAGVYCVVGSLARFKPVDIVYQGDGYTLVRASKSAEGSAILRAGDEVVVTASDIEPGKVIE